MVARLRHFELIALQPRLALLILVTQESAVRQMMLHLPQDSDQAELSRLAETLVAVSQGLSADELEGRVIGASDLGRHVLEQVTIGLRGLNSVERTQIRHSGIESILNQPEFAGTEAQSVLDLVRSCRNSRSPTMCRYSSGTRTPPMPFDVSASSWQRTASTAR
jgi:transcriptional regulator of heat shock response